MQRLCFAVALVACPSVSWAVPAFVNATCVPGVTNTATTTSWTAAPGDMILVAVDYDISGGATLPTDTLGSGFSAAGNSQPGASRNVQLFYAAGIDGGVEQISERVVPASAGFDLWVFEFSGIASFNEVYPTGAAGTNSRPDSGQFYSYEPYSLLFALLAETGDSGEQGPIWTTHGVCGQATEQDTLSSNMNFYTALWLQPMSSWVVAAASFEPTTLSTADSGSPSDAGSASDGGAAADSGLPAADAGGTGPGDGGSDGGVGPGRVNLTVGCGCAGAGHGIFLALLAMASWFTAARRRPREL